MKGLKPLFILIAAAVMAAVFLAGCTTPTPTPAPTATPTVPPAISPAPTPVVTDDKANIAFSYIQREYSQSYEGIPAGPGELIYAFDVTVDADKPIYTDGSWFTIEYRQNASAELKTYEPMTIIGYPSMTIGNGSGPAKGRLLLALKAPGEGATGPTPVYWKPLDRQEGPNKVYSKVYGVIRTS
ncbi:MAG: hypothetical protein A4E28_02188 [Methanocella sp. PtaU1.Bin125]|nr:MAG: hypothetical protein A4E28_02188 [Methanocella sp. PtaU1.Bin125]